MSANDAKLYRVSEPQSEHNVGHSTSLRTAGASASCIGTSELPSVALLRHFLFPVSTLVGLLLSAGLFSQPITRPYIVLAVLATVLTWQLLSSAEFNELKPLAQIELFLPRVIFGWTRVLGILFFLGFAAKMSAAYSRAVIATWTVATPIVFSLAHICAYRFLCRWNRRGRIARTHIIVGIDAQARELALRLERDPSLGTFIGFFDQRARNAGAERNTLGDFDNLPEYVRRNSIDVIHIACSAASHPGLKHLLTNLRDTTASIYFILDVPRHDHYPIRMVEMAGVPLLAYFETPHCGLQGVTKRLVDIAVTSALLVFLWPVMLLITVLVRMDSPGPAIFKQHRYGLNGEEILVYKFRTMTVCEDDGDITQVKRDDPRTTRIGRFLRRTSLDELPQLFCVLAGSMSLVGPRPHAVAHNEQYRRLIDGYMLRHKIRPGITGWAQVNGLRGETRTLEQMRARISYDLEYLRHWSPWVDLKILLRTALLVVHDPNAF